MGAGDIENPDLTYAREVSGFYLDRFEVTVGRFSRFLDHFNVPSEGDGANPMVLDSGWRNAWTTVVDQDRPPETAVPPTKEALITQITEATHCSASTFATGQSDLPVNCVNWYVAFLFCLYDGGRLPTEAEWNYAAAHGDSERPFPWSQSVGDTTLDTTDAAYFDGAALLALPTPVGTHPAGAGGFFRNVGQGHEDLAGNVVEWTADQWLDAPPATCSGDCMAPWDPVIDDRVIRGGSFQTGPIFLRSGARTSSPAFNVGALFGLRCARDANTRTKIRGTP
jgi:formylglycine-generating enzyme required for sulfatase activity